MKVWEQTSVSLLSETELLLPDPYLDLFLSQCFFFLSKMAVLPASSITRRRQPPSAQSQNAHTFRAEFVPVETSQTKKLKITHLHLLWMRRNSLQTLANIFVLSLFFHPMTRHFLINYFRCICWEKESVLVEVYTFFCMIYYYFFVLEEFQKFHTNK